MLKKRIVTLLALFSVIAFAAVPSRQNNGLYVSPYLHPEVSGLPLGSSTLRWQAWINELNTQLSAGIAYVDALGKLNSDSTVTLDGLGGITAAFFYGDLVGNASTATALAADPSSCPPGEYAYDADEFGTLTCGVPTGEISGPVSSTDNAVALWDGVGGNALKDSQLIVNGSTASIPFFSGDLLGNASTATALAADPSPCPTGEYAYDADEFGNLTCATPDTGGGAANSVTDDQTQAGHGFSIGDVIRHSSTAWVKAQADSLANAEAYGIVSAIPDGDNFTVTTHGYISGLSGLTAGGTYYLSESVAGGYTLTAPSSVGQVVKPVLLALGSSTGYVFIQRSNVIADEGSAVQIYGSRIAPRDIVAGTGITSGASHMSTTDERQVVFIQGSGGAVNISANPQIEAHTVVGAEMTLMGRSDSSTVTLETGNGLDLNGDAVMGASHVIRMQWDGSNWLEVFRNF